ncbi:MAG TPA: S41 family peptidase [Aggregatilineales bacterium]|nr:S41 family peptidase [Aggregatilineales bacterium]
MSNWQRFRHSIFFAVLQGVLLGLLLLGIFAAGYWFRETPAGIRFAPEANSASAVGNYPLLTEVQDLLNHNYLRDQPDQKALEYAAIRGVLSALNDKYTFLVDPPVAHSESDVLAGKYGGIGVEVRRDENGNFALYPFPNSPASKAGLQNGDILLQVNGKDVPTTTQQDAVDQMLRGEVRGNNGVIIHIRRPSAQTELDFTIPFAEIDVPSVLWQTLDQEPTFGYIQILRFTNRTPDEVKQAIGDLQGKNVKALVLDLRDNPGGLLQEAVDVAGEFVKGGVVLYKRSRESEQTYTADDGNFMTDLPMTVLIDNNTASAAEILAGALHDRKRAEVIGQQSFGKGTVQLLFTLADQSSLHVTTAEWLSPSRNPIDGKGIMPDIPMIPDPNGRDVDIGEAITYLKTGKS